VHVPSGGPHTGLSQEALDGVEIHPGFHKRGSEGVAESMQPTRLGHPGPVFRSLEHEGGGCEGKRLGAIPAGTPPRVWTIDAPRRPEVRQEAGRQERLTVLLALALHHAHTHATAVKVGDVQRHAFARPQPGILRHLQEGLVPQGRSGSTPLADVVATEEDREGAGFLRQWNGTVHRRAAQRGPVEKPQTMHNGIAGAGGAAPFRMELEARALHVARRQGVRATRVRGGEVSDRPERDPLGGWGEPTDGHVLDPALLEGGHGVLLACGINTCRQAVWSTTRRVEAHHAGNQETEERTITMGRPDRPETAATAASSNRWLSTVGRGEKVGAIGKRAVGENTASLSP
jgi:hypothetical protein